jgi:hypothetical protein
MSQKRKANDGRGGAPKPSEPSRDEKLETAVMMNARPIWPWPSTWGVRGASRSRPPGGHQHPVRGREPLTC